MATKKQYKEDKLIYEKGNLNRITDVKAYVIDFDKVKTLEDVVAILKAFNIKIFGAEFTKGIEHLVREES